MGSQQAKQLPATPKLKPPAIPLGQQVQLVGMGLALVFLVQSFIEISAANNNTVNSHCAESTERSSRSPADRGVDEATGAAGGDGGRAAAVNCSALDA